MRDREDEQDGGTQLSARTDIVAGLVGEACDQRKAELLAASSKHDSKVHRKRQSSRHDGSHRHVQQKQRRRLREREQFTVTFSSGQLASNDHGLLHSLLFPERTSISTSTLTHATTPATQSQSLQAGQSRSGLSTKPHSTTTTTSSIKTDPQRYPLHTTTSRTSSTSKQSQTTPGQKPSEDRGNHTTSSKQKPSTPTSRPTAYDEGKKQGQKEQHSNAPPRANPTRTSSKATSSRRPTMTRSTTSLGVANTSGVVRVCAARPSSSTSVSNARSAESGSTLNLRQSSSTASQATSTRSLTERYGRTTASTRISGGQTTIFDYGCSASPSATPSLSDPSTATTATASSSSVDPIGNNANGDGDQTAPVAFFATSGGKGTIAGVSIAGAAVVAGLALLLVIWRKRQASSAGAVFLAGRRHSGRSSTSSFGDSTTSLPRMQESYRDGNWTQENLNASQPYLPAPANERSFFVESRRFDSFPRGQTVPAGAFAGTIPVTRPAMTRANLSEEQDPFGDPSSSGHGTSETQHTAVSPDMMAAWHATGLSGAVASSDEDYNARNHQRRRSGYMSDTYRTRKSRSRPLSVRNPDSDETVPSELHATASSDGGHHRSESYPNAYNMASGPAIGVVPPSPEQQRSQPANWQPWSDPQSYASQHPNTRASTPPISTIYPYYSNSPQEPQGSFAPGLPQQMFVHHEAAGSHGSRGSSGDPAGRRTPASSISSSLWRPDSVLDNAQAGPPRAPWLNEGVETPHDIQDVQLGTVQGAGGRSAGPPLGLAGGDSYFTR